MGNLIAVRNRFQYRCLGLANSVWSTSWGRMASTSLSFRSCWTSVRIDFILRTCILIVARLSVCQRDANGVSSLVSYPHLITYWSLSRLNLRTSINRTPDGTSNGVNSVRLSRFLRDHPSQTSLKKLEVNVNSVVERRDTKVCYCL